MQCNPRKETENNASVRCSSPSASRDQRFGADPSRVATPRTTVALNAATNASPLAREANHKACDPLKALTLPLREAALLRIRGCSKEPVQGAR